MMPILYIILALAILVFSGDFLVKGAVSVALKFKISMMIVGLTVVSFATSAPELFVSLMSALKGNSNIALGNVIGSNIANITLVLGPTALIYPIVVQKRVYTIDWIVMASFSLLFGYFLYTDSSLVFWEGLVLFLGLLLYISTMIRSERKRKQTQLNENPETETELSSDELSWTKSIVFLLLGIVGLKYGSELLINQVILMAEAMHISDRVISLTFVAFGTSIPELTASLVAAYKGQEDISVGNLIGSNVFNIASVIGITAMIQPIGIQDANIFSDWLWMCSAAALLVILILLHRLKKLNRLSGLILLLFYLVYTLQLFY
ncbi:MAG: calcium/sodium antiporter [Flavobacteriales bacterium]